MKTNLLINKSTGQIGAILKKGFASENQRRLLWMKHPYIAKKWAHDIPAGSSASSPERMPKGKSAKIKGKKPKSKKERAKILREANKLKKEKMMCTITGETDHHDLPEIG